MVRSDCGAAGVMFTMDTESGFRDVVFITSSYGLGETVVQGAVNPDEFYVYKPTLSAGKPAILRRSLGSTAGIGAVAASSCRFATSLQFQSYTVGLTVAGVTLFRSAESIAGARNARLAAGGVLLSAASVLLLSIFIVSRFQSKRLKWAMSALFFTTTAVWSPFLMESSMQWEMLLQSPLFILYLCVTFVCGMMVVAYFESGSTTRSADGGSAAITVLAHCIRACGVVCVVLGVSDVHVAAAVVAAEAAEAAEAAATMNSEGKAQNDNSGAPSAPSVVLN
jgi:hypothetical protein